MYMHKKEVLCCYSYRKQIKFPKKGNYAGNYVSVTCQKTIGWGSQTLHLTLGTEKAWITDVIKWFIAQPVKYTISQYPFSLSKTHAWLVGLTSSPWSCRWGSVVRWSVWGVRRQASLTVDRYSGHHARKSGLGHLSAVRNRIKILELSPHSQTAFALESTRLTWQMGDY